LTGRGERLDTDAVVDRVALVDLGSNAVRFALASVIPGHSFRLAHTARAETRLASGRAGLLSGRSIRTTVAATRRFLARVDDGRPLRVVAIATSAVRDAGNAHRLIDALRRAAGIEVEVLGWEEEARLGAVAALASLPLRDALVIDLGGGSLQLTLVQDRAITPLTSLPLGALRATRRFLWHDPPTPGELRALRQEAAALIGSALPPLPIHAQLVGLGGTFRTLARMHLAAGRRRRASVHGFVLRRADVDALGQRLQSLPLRRRRRLPGLKARRADIIVAGTVVLDEAMAAAGRTALTVCERGVRHGLLIRETFGLEKRV
jgi:exopolyphosphatase / guanosine-5'-triphosphate,3'-diphosphate pyrophosphatase